MSHTRQIVSLSALFVSSAVACVPAFAQKSQAAKPSYVLQCHGVTNASTALKQDGPKATIDKSADVLRIARFGRIVRVQVNAASYQSMDRKAREILQTSDPYKITGETGEGFAAVFIDGSTTLHTLTVDRSLTYGIWTESGFSFLQPQGKPISNTVFFTCTQEKQ
jgi:hypothetical protein